MSSDSAMGTGFAGLFNRSLGVEESMSWVVVAMMFGGWRRSLKDARVSAEAWERSADRTQPECLFLWDAFLSFVVGAHSTLSRSSFLGRNTQNIGDVSC